MTLKLADGTAATIADYRVAHLAREIRGKNRPGYAVWAEEPGVQVRIDQLTEEQRAAILAAVPE